MPDTPNRDRRSSAAKGSRPLWLLVLTVAVLVALPMLAILRALGTPTTETWDHIRETLLAEYVLNSLLLMLQVGAYTLVMGGVGLYMVTHSF